MRGAPAAGAALDFLHLPAQLVQVSGLAVQQFADHALAAPCSEYSNSSRP